MINDERYVDVLAGLEKIRQEKPYQDTAAAVSALDWLSTAIDDIRKALKQATDSPTDLAKLHELLTTSESIAVSIESRIEQNGGKVPARHHTRPGPTTGI